MSDHDPISTFPEETETLYSRSLASQWRRRWTGSLRFRLLALGLMPLLVAFPLVIAALVVLGGQRAQALLESNLRSHLAASRNYLSQVRLETGVRVTQLARSERMRDLLAPDTPQETRQRALAAAAESSGLDYLLLAMADGRVLGANTPVAEGARLPDSFVIRQAAIGVANIFSSFLSGALRNPAAAAGQFSNLIFGFAVTEALGIFSFLIALLLMFAV